MRLGIGVSLSQQVFRRGGVSVPVLPLKVVAEGDSITAQTSPVTYTRRWAAANPAVPYANTAVSGAELGQPSDLANAPDNTGTGTNVWAKADYVLSLQPSILTLMIGANGGALGGLTTGAIPFSTRIFEYVARQKAQRPGLKVLLCSNFPRQDNASQAYNDTYNAAVLEIDAIFRAAVGNQIDAYAPIGTHPYFDAAAPNGGVYWSGIDKLHPAQAAHDIAAEIYGAALDALVAGSTATSPTAFSFTDAVNVELSTVTTGAPIIIKGQAPTRQTSVTATLLASVGQGAFSANPGSVMNGDAVRPRVTSSAANLTAADNAVTIGTTSDTYTATTKAANPPGFVALGTSALISASGSTTHTISFTLPVAGRPIMGLLRAGTITSLSIKDGGNAVVATGTSRESVGSTPRHLVSFNNTIPAGTYTLEVVGSNVGSITVTAWIGYLTGSNGGFTDSDKDAVLGIHNPNTLKMANQVSVAPGGIMVLFVNNNAAFNSYGSNTLVSSYTDGTNWHWFTNSATGDGAMNNASATSAGMLGASFT